MYNKEKGQVVEVYAYQFGWLVRYAGVDNQLGRQIIPFLYKSTWCNYGQRINDTYEEIDKKVSNIDQELKGNETQMEIFNSKI